MKSLKIFLPLAISLFLVTELTTRNIRREAENNLKKEEVITGTRNRYILSEQKARKDFENERRQAQDDWEFKRSLGLN